MWTWRTNLTLMMCVCIIATTASAQSQNRLPVAPADMQYRYEAAPPGFLDIVTMQDGTKYVGKIMEWADEVWIFNPAGNPTRVPTSQVDTLLFRRDDRAVPKPALPDLTVQYIERSPHESSFRGLVNDDGTARNGAAQPQRHQPGQQITLRISIANGGFAPSQSVSVAVYADDQTIKTAELPAIAPGDSHVVETTWNYNLGAKQFRVLIDPDGKQEEAARWNNSFVEPVQALGVLVRVSPELGERGFGLTYTHNVADFVQYQLQSFNALMAASTHDVAPNGIVERIRCDKLDIAPTDATPVPDGRYDAVIEFKLPEDSQQAAGYTLRMDWPTMRSLAAQLGLADPSPLDTGVAQSRMYNRFGRPALVEHTLSDSERGFMGGVAGSRFSRVEAAYLNAVRGKPRGARGSYLNQIPGNIGFVVHDRDGKPLPGVEVGIFQLGRTETGDCLLRGAGGNSPLIEAATDESGGLQLPNRPVTEAVTVDDIAARANAFGTIAQDYSNGLMAVRLRHGGKETFHFISVLDAQNAALDGHEQQWLVTFHTPFVAGEVPASPPYVVPLSAEETEAGKAALAWPLPRGVALDRIREWHLYERRGYDGQDREDWRLREVRLPGENALRDLIDATDVVPDFTPGQREEDVFVSIALVAKDGSLGSMSEPGFLSSASQARSLAIWSDTAFISLDTDGPIRMLYWDSVAGTQPYMPINNAEPGYEPHFAGLAFRDATLIAADPVNHCIAMYDVTRDRHTLTRVVPKQDGWPGAPGFMPGAFAAPQDVAVDADGRIYVADTGNHRVQILNGQGEPQGLLDPDFRFLQPSAVCFAFGHVCVTDNAGTRVRVYQIADGKATFKLELPQTSDAGRAIVDHQGQVFVCAAREPGDERSLLRFASDGASATFVENVQRSDLGAIVRPRGLYQHGNDATQAYFVNDFPFGVRRVQLAPQP